MDLRTFQQIIQKARESAPFFHALVFQPERALAEFGLLDEAAKEKVGKVNAGAVVAMALGELAACDGTYTCSCTSGTCDGTCGGSTCDVTCSGDSCGRTCDDSCGYTTNIVVRPELLDPSTHIQIQARHCGLDCGETCPCTSGYSTECPNSCAMTRAGRAAFGCGETCQATCGNLTCTFTCSGETVGFGGSEEWR